MNNPLTCPTCGKEFRSKRSKQTYCSIECRNKRKPHICQICGITFYGGEKNALYCSRNCQGIAGRKTLNCLNCGKVFIVPKSKTRTYCSPECAVKHATPKRMKRTIYTCQICGKTFEAKTCRNRRYCSRECTGKVRKSRALGIQEAKHWQTSPCQWCGVSFTRYSTVKVRFCSRDCFYAWESEARKGINNPAFVHGKYKPGRGQNWERQRGAALKRDGYKCQICGRKIKCRAWDHGVHHIRAYHNFNGDWLTANTLSNLITLCRRCHTDVEQHGLPCPQPLL